jgi:hypothetical protein
LTIHGTNHNAIPRPEVTRKAFEALDDLPDQLRQEVCFSARLWDATMVRELFQKNIYLRGRQGSINWLVASIHAGDEQDLSEFAGKYRMRYGVPLPHTAASATILRYTPVVRTGKAIHQRHIIPLRSRTAWREAQALMPQDYEPSEFMVEAAISPEVEGRFAGLDIMEEEPQHA